MRIRKNARFGGLVSTEKLRPLMCQLNQSPWDVIPFNFDLIQFGYGEDDSFIGNANASTGNYSGVVENIASPTDTKLKSLPNIQNVVVHDMSEQNGIAQLDHKAAEENKMTNNEAKKQRQSKYTSNNLSSMRSKKAIALARAQTMKKAPSRTSNPYEFYYYSGFGPLWGKQRGDRNGRLSNKNDVKVKGLCEDSMITEANGATIQSHCSSSHIDTNGFDYVDDKDDEVEEDYNELEERNNGKRRKKRMKKPMKARSLKSLM